LKRRVSSRCDSLGGHLSGQTEVYSIKIGNYTHAASFAIADRSDCGDAGGIYLVAGAGEPQDTRPARRLVVDGGRVVDGLGRFHFFSGERFADVLGGPRGRNFVVAGGRIDAGANKGAIRMGDADVCGAWRTVRVARTCSNCASLTAKLGTPR